MKHALLAIETATHACSVALMSEDQISSRFQLAPKEHVQLVFPMIESLLGETGMVLKDIRAIAVGRGPGSFTGVRIAMSIAQGLGYGLAIPIYGVSTLAALAYQAKLVSNSENALLVPALDARMQEVYAAVFTQDMCCLQDEKVCSPLAMLAELPWSESQQEIIAIGSGWDVYLQDIQRNHPDQKIHFLPDRHPHAEQIALIATAQIQRGEKGVLAHEALPVYLRDNVAVKSSLT